MEEVAKYDGEKQEEIVKTNGVKMDVQDQITSLIPLAGTIELTTEQDAVLYEPINPEAVEIRPDGLIYLPWMEYVTKLRKAFGMSWTLIPYGPPKKLGTFIHWAFWLIIKGKPYGFAVGEQQYFENSERMTYGDALEGAKSNALMRVCKGLGISLELWKPSFVKEWKEKYAESYKHFNKRKNKEEILWRKRGTKANEEEIIETEENKEQPSPTQQETKKRPYEPITEQQKKLVWAKLKEKNIAIDNLEGFMKKKLSEFNKYPDTNEALDWIAKQTREPGEDG